MRAVSGHDCPGGAGAGPAQGSHGRFLASKMLLLRELLAAEAGGPLAA